MDLQRDFCKKTADRLQGAIRARLVDKSTMTAAGNCQTSQAMAIYYDVFDPSEKLAAFQILLDRIRDNDNHIDT